MSMNRLAQVVAIVLTLGAGAGFATAGAQQTAGDLVTTTCDAGHVTECGSKPVKVTCDFAFGVTWGGTNGFTISFTKCTGHGEIKLYKDFHRGAATGACVVTSFPTDPRRDEDVADDFSTDSSC